MLIDQLFDYAGCQAGKQELQAFILSLIAGSVELEIFEKEQQLLKMIRCRPVIYRVRRMGKRMNDVLCLQVRCQIEDAAARLLNVLVLCFIYIVGKHVDFAAVFREIDGNPKPRFRFL